MRDVLMCKMVMACRSLQSSAYVPLLVWQDTSRLPQVQKARSRSEAHLETCSASIWKQIYHICNIYIYIRIKNTILHNVQIYSRIENNVYIYTYATSHWIFRQTSLAISTAHPFLRRWMGLHSGAGASDESETA